MATPADDTQGRRSADDETPSRPRRRMATAEAARERAPAITTADGAAQAGRAAGAALVGRSSRRGRVSSDTQGGWNGGAFLSGGPGAIVAPKDADADWSVLKLDSNAFNRLPPHKLLEILRGISPEMSKAVWDFLRQANAGYTVRVLTPGTATPHAQGQAVIDAFLDRLDDLYGAVDVVWNRLYLSLLFRGAIAAEIVLDLDGREAVDLAVIDPIVLRFKKVPDPVRGEVWELGQWQGGEWVPLVYPTIRYVPVDPMPNDPYGQSLVSSAPFVCIFLLALLHDLRRVVQQQGYPRLDFSIDLEILKGVMPVEIQNDDSKRGAWINAAIAEIQQFYATLEPEDAYVHTSAIVVNRPVGAVDSSSLGAVDGLIKGLERVAARALKSNVLLMVMTEGLSEASANRVWESHLGGVKSIQHLVENCAGRLFGVMLQAVGIQAVVELEFAENRASEMLRDEQTRTLKIGNEKSLYDFGLTTHAEMSENLVGHAPAGPPPPVAADQFELTKQSAAAKAQAGVANPEPGANK